MSDLAETWPPAPSAARAKETEPAQPAPEVKTCGACGRKLLTQASILCNWCGAKIDDETYQARAAEERLARDQAERERVEAIVQEEAQYGVLGRLRRRAKMNPGNKSGNNTLS